ncbi:hypothetical protein GGX14DRAFT_425900 [Mycena pura]|uniref:Uncharacterized protein n=1 Tax=Mycena pura TaxID=153505 RepID=A0AAD7E326_9AGAR|nr:hypothetical protein GGX14DRAFT_425900 [Mycena pura]
MSAHSSHIEFEAPPSAITPAVEKRHYSIDLSLELERQLDAESFPPTPVPHSPPPQPSHHHVSMPLQMPDIDPHVLAHIISQLRHQLADMTKERDDLLALLSAAHTKEAELEDALQHITDKAMSLDDALSDARKKSKEDDEAISMLRTKVEESRRGLMRIQAESRRQSVQPGTLDVARANAPSAFSLTPASSKRASFTPLTGTFAANSFTTRPNGHRRISSISDSNVPLPDAAAVVVPERSLSVAAVSQPSNNRRLSGIFGRSSPPQRPKSLSPSPSPDELEKLRKDVTALQETLDATRHELAEANEAREASETCAAALRDFIAENNPAMGEVKLPPLPAATTGDEPDTNAQKKGWAFKLWKVDTSVNRATGPASAASTTATASPVVPPAAVPFVAANTSTPPAPAAAPAALSRKLTGFFSSRMSGSTPAPLQTGPGHVYRDSVYSTSDASSVAEPISPTSQVGPAEVHVRDAGGSPDIGPDSVEAVKDAPERLAEMGVADEDASVRSVQV